MKTYVSYLRDSGGPDQTTSTDQQAHEVEELAQREGYIITRQFRDRARSGASTAGRDQFLAMIAYLENPTTSEAGVILWSYSRFARDYDDTQFYLALLRRAGREIISVADTIPEGLDGRLMESLVAWQNAKFLETLSADVRRGLDYSVRQHCGWIGGPAPMGYRLVRQHSSEGREVSRLIPNPIMSPLVVEAFRARARGETFATISRGLGISVSGAGHLLRNPIYTGVFVSEQYDFRVEDFCEPLISRELWDEVQRMNNKNFHPRTLARNYILSHILTCGLCGGKMSGHTSGERTKIEYYRCRNHALHIGNCPARGIRKDTLEPVVLAAIGDYLSDTVRVEDVYNQAMQDHKPLADVAALERELKATRSRIGRATSAIVEVGHSAALLDALTKLEQTRDMLMGQIQQADNQQLPSLESVLSRTRDLLDSLHNATPAQMRLLVSEVVESVSAKLDDDGLDVEIVYRVCMGG